MVSPLEVLPLTDDVYQFPVLIDIIFLSSVVGGGGEKWMFSLTVYITMDSNDNTLNSLRELSESIITNQFLLLVTMFTMI